MAKEYIEREAVINRLQTVSMPDDPYSKGIQHGVVHSIAVINEAPAADVVEVVRCKDCKHRVDWHEEGYSEDAGMCIGSVNHIVAPEHFCSYGERRDSNGNKEIL